MNSYQKKIGIGIVALLFLSVLIVPVIAEQPSFSGHNSSFSLRYVMLGDFLADPGYLDPRYTLNVVFIAAEWVMIGVLGAFGLWFSNKGPGAAPEGSSVPAPIAKKSSEDIERDRRFTRHAALIGGGLLLAYFIGLGWIMISQ